jgi:hypothetical protein
MDEPAADRAIVRAVRSQATMRVLMGAAVIAAMVAAGAYVLTVRRGAPTDGKQHSTTQNLPMANDVAFSNTGAATADADRVMGYTGAGSVRPLAPLPELEGEDTEAGTGDRSDIGSAMRPAVYVRFAARPIAEVVDAYAAMWKVHAGEYEVAARTSSGWTPVLEVQASSRVTELACSVDILVDVQIGVDTVRAVEKLQAGCPDLARRLGATIEGTLDVASIERANAELHAARENARPEIELILASSGRRFTGRDVHRVARGLGFVRSDLGSYAWLNPSGIGYDLLLVMRPGDAGFELDFSRPDATYESLTIGFDADQVPVPALVAQRLWTAADAVCRELGCGITDVDRKEIRQAALDARVQATIGKLAPFGMLVPAHAVVHGEPPR